MIGGLILTLGFAALAASEYPHEPQVAQTNVAVLGISEPVANLSIREPMRYGSITQSANPAIGTQLHLIAPAGTKAIASVDFEDGSRRWIGIAHAGGSEALQGYFPNGDLIDGTGNARGELVDFGTNERAARAWAAEPIGREPIPLTVWIIGAVALVAVGLVWQKKYRTA
jgi:hypothetical protein